MANKWYSAVIETRHEEVNEFIQQKENPGWAERTLNDYSRILKEFFNDVVPRLTLGEVEVQHVEEYVTVYDPDAEGMGAAIHPAVPAR